MISVFFPDEDFILPENDNQHFLNSIERAHHWEHNNNTVELYVHKRNNEGWLEYGINVRNAQGSRIIYIGAIQRRPGGDSEFHS